MLERERVFYAARNKRLLHQQIQQREIEAYNRQEEQQTPVPPTNTGCITVQRQPFAAEESDNEPGPSAAAVVEGLEPSVAAVVDDLEPSAATVVDDLEPSVAAVVHELDISVSAVAIYTEEDRAELIRSFAAVNAPHQEEEEDILQLFAST